MVNSSDLASSDTCLISIRRIHFRIYIQIIKQQWMSRMYSEPLSHNGHRVVASLSEAKGHVGPLTAVDMCATKVTLIRGANITGLHFIIIVEGQ